jgi:hypothetical protein
VEFKIDENLHSDAAGLLRRHGHDAVTVYDQLQAIGMTRLGQQLLRPFRVT